MTKRYNWLFMGLLAVTAIALFSIDFHTAHAALALASFGADPHTAASVIGFGGIGRLTIQQMREKRNELSGETRNLLDKNTHAEWNDDLQKKYDENIGEIERIDAAIEREQRMLDLSAERHFKEAGGRELDLEAETPMNAARKAFNKLLRNGERAMTDEDWGAIRNTMSTTTDSQGGYTVPTDVATSVLDALKAYGGMRQAATVIRTAGGNPMNFPTSDGTSEEGEIISQNSTANDLDPSFGVKTIGSFKYSSKVITVPFELLQDSAVDVEAFVRDRISMRLGRVTNKHFTVGAGTTEPNGVVTAASVGKTGAVSATPAITYDDLLDLQHSVDPAYRLAAKWMLHDQTVKLIRKLKDDANRPIWLPSYDAGVRGGVPAELLGDAMQINQHMATPAADAKTIAYGDFSKYLIRDSMDMQLFRFTDSAYTKKGQVGFLAWMRSDGNLIDVGGAIKTFAHGAAS